MQIHRVKKGETLYSIGREYGVSPSKIAEINRIKNPDLLATGRELLILVPTRTYTARRGDTLEGISKRFSVSKSEIFKNNPSLSGADKIYPEEVFALKYPEKNHGIALLNGYLYRDCPRDKFKLTLPYLSHLTVSSCVYENGRLRYLFDSKEARMAAKELGKRVLLRIYLKELYGKGDSCEKFIGAAKDAALAGGFDGITLSGIERLTEGSPADFLFSFKRAMLEAGLTLSLESSGKISERCADMADSVILCSDECFSKDLSEWERIYGDYAEGGEPIKAFIDLSPFAYREKEPIPIENALAYADSEGLEIIHSENGMTASFRRGGEEIIFPTLKSTKAKLDLTAELGYLGYSIDIMRCPVSHLMMLSSLFHLSPTYFSGGI